MYAHLHRRFQHTLEDCIELLALAAVPRQMAPTRTQHLHQPPDPIRAAIPSSASSPSLRSKEMVAVTIPAVSAAPANPGGNVKVVVRVRGFLQRGEESIFIESGLSSCPVPLNDSLNIGLELYD